VAEPARSSRQDSASQNARIGLSGRLALHSGGPVWRKSSYSGYNGDCVEVAVLRGGQIGVRDSKAHGTGPVLCLTSAQWAALVAGVRSGRLDLG
jgi:hypothetical protein